jgi:hypothetical protein
LFVQPLLLTKLDKNQIPRERERERERDERLKAIKKKSLNRKGRVGNCAIYKKRREKKD